MTKEEQLAKYGDGSAVKEWEFKDRHRQARRVCINANKFAIPALKALDLPITIENVVAQVDNREYARDTYRETKFKELNRQITDLERTTFERFINEETSKRIGKLYLNFNNETLSGLDAAYYSRWLYLDGEELKVNTDSIARDNTKYLETPEEQKIWDLLCQTCDNLNTLFDGRIKIDLDLRDYITTNKSGDFVPRVPIYDGNFGKVSTD